MFLNKIYKMILHDIVKESQEKDHPVARVIHRNEHFKVIGLSFKKGTELKEHVAHKPTTLIVTEGEVVYSEGDTERILLPRDIQVIPVEKPHAVRAIKDSLCFLTQG